MTLREEADDLPSEGEEAPAPTDGGAAARLLAVVHAVDEIVDGWFEPLRGAPALDGAAKVITGLGDRGLMWVATTLWRVRRSGPDRARAVRALAIAGAESAAVNTAIKSLVGRSRPDRAGLRVIDGGVPVREPTSSSFPSGHTLAAFCAATVMSEPGNPAGSALLFGCAALVGLSRLHLRAHHASDVVGGALVGIALGVVGRRLV
jgi:undecaprenyl-diphosphatase